MNSKNSIMPKGMNIEVTTSCPLHCPQCYCTLDGGKNIPFEIASDFIKQAKEIGVQHVELSGGETLCYPHLIDLISFANKLGLETNIPISGWGFDENILNELVQAGVTRIFVSLNGPTEELNRKSRNGFHHAITALDILHRKHFKKVYINWVMHRGNADYLPDMIRLAEKYDVQAIDIIGPKPTSARELNTLPTQEQMKKAVEVIRSSPLGKVAVENCFSPLLAMVCDTPLLGNLNVGRNKGCGAGYNLFSVSVDGLLSPCRHLEYYEKFSSIEDYWNNSVVLQRLREMDREHPEELCNSCRFMNYCRPCAAINSIMENRLYRGNKFCTAYETEKTHRQA